MRTIVAILMAAGLAASGQQYSTQNSAGATNTGASTWTAAVYWPGSMLPLRLLSVDVTSDLAGSLLTWRVGTTPVPAASAATAAATNVVCYTNSLASNDVVLLQNSTNGVTKATVWGTSKTTNSLVQFQGPWHTNLAAGDVFMKYVTNLNLSYAAASNATTLYVDSTNGVTTNALLIAKLKDGFLWSATMTVVAQSQCYTVPLSGPAVTDLAVGDAVYVRSATNTQILGPSAKTDTTLCVSSVAKFTNGSVILILAANGETAIATVSTTSATNFNLSGQVGIATTIGDQVYKLVNATTAALPSSAGAVAISLAATNGIMTPVLTTNGLVQTSIIVANPASGAPWQRLVPRTCPTNSVYTLTLTGGTPGAWTPPVRLMTATNTYKLALAASALDTSCLITNITTGGLSNTVDVFCAPATGGTFRNRVVGLTTNQILSTVSMSAALGIPLSLGDQLYSSITQTAAVGAATLRLQGSALFYAPPGRPAALSINGTSACAINSATGYYQ